MVTCNAPRPQQVNNASAAPNSTSRVGKHPTLKNKLLKENGGRWLDPGAVCTPSRADLIWKWRPWEKSTGPETKVGKARVLENVYKGGALHLNLAKLRVSDTAKNGDSVILNKISSS